MLPRGTQQRDLRKKMNQTLQLTDNTEGAETASIHMRAQESDIFYKKTSNTQFSHAKIAAVKQWWPTRRPEQNGVHNLVL